MLKYIAAVVLVAAMSLYVSTQYKRHAQTPNCYTKQPANGVLALPANEDAKANECKPEWNPPRWYRLFGWESLQTWGLFLTLVVIADQTKQTAIAAKATARAAEAAEKQVIQSTTI